MAPIIETRHLTKQYGKLTALSDVNLTVEEDAVFGFIGPNGAGKTTTMRILTTLLRPTSGEAFVAGASVARDPRAVRRVIGYMPDFFGVYDDMKVWEYLDFFAACYDIPESKRHGLVDDLLNLVDLQHRRDDFVDKLSRGMKQRLCLARTLAHDPQVLILDEPASGLDPRARIEIRELLRELRRMGKTIFFSSHILSEVAEICTHIGVIEAGKLVTAGSLEDIRQRLIPHRVLKIDVLDRAEDARALLVALPGVVEVRAGTGEETAPGRHQLAVDFSGDDVQLSALPTALGAQGIPVVGFSEDKADLEDVFMRITQGIVS
jgi:ABC-2 type transport system ATP-binding protein